MIPLIDKTVFKLESSNCKCGYTSYNVLILRNFGAAKNVIFSMGISSDRIIEMWRHDYRVGEGTTIDQIYGFVAMILGDLDLNDPGLQFVLTTDNLSPHKSWYSDNDSCMCTG